MVRSRSWGPFALALLNPGALCGLLLLASPPAQVALPDRQVPVTGRVVDVLGDPIPTAEVWIAPYWRTESRGIAVASDSNGRFALPGVRLEDLHDRVVVRATAGEKSVSEVVPSYQMVRGGALRLPDLVLRDAQPFRGVITDPDGNPIPRARVSVSGDRSVRVTDEDGRFEAAFAQAGVVGLAVAARGFETVWMHRVVRQPDRTRIQLPRGRVTRVWVEPESQGSADGLKRGPIELVMRAMSGPVLALGEPLNLHSETINSGVDYSTTVDFSFPSSNSLKMRMGPGVPLLGHSVTRRPRAEEDRTFYLPVVAVPENRIPHTFGIRGGQGPDSFLIARLGGRDEG